MNVYQHGELQERILITTPIIRPRIIRSVRNYDHSETRKGHLKKNCASSNYNHPLVLQDEGLQHYPPSLAIFQFMIFAPIFSFHTPIWLVVFIHYHGATKLQWMRARHALQMPWVRFPSRPQFPLLQLLILSLRRPPFCLQSRLTRCIFYLLSLLMLSH